MNCILLTKAQLLQGSLYTEELQIEGIGRVKVRALSDGERTEIEAQYMIGLHDAGITPKDLGGGKPELTIEKTVHMANLAKEKDWKIAAKALSVPGGEEWFVEDAKGLHEDIILAVVQKAELLTSGKRGQIESFPGQSGGLGSEVAGEAGV